MTINDIFHKLNWKVLERAIAIAGLSFFVSIFSSLSHWDHLLIQEETIDKLETRDLDNGVERRTKNG